MLNAALPSCPCCCQRQSKIEYCGGVDLIMLTNIFAKMNYSKMNFSTVDIICSSRQVKEYINDSSLAGVCAHCGCSYQLLLQRCLLERRALAHLPQQNCWWERWGNLEKNLLLPQFLFQLQDRRDTGIRKMVKVIVGTK